jgi:hypothetical protein
VAGADAGAGAALVYVWRACVPGELLCRGRVSGPAKAEFQKVADLTSACNCSYQPPLNQVDIHTVLVDCTETLQKDGIRV